ncbi:MAG: MFS transporter [Propionibacteriaceae bacterium]|nr:MFS transporter [Propionibacteriaceae bacterium]
MKWRRNAILYVAGQGMSQFGSSIVGYAIAFHLALAGHASEFAISIISSNLPIALLALPAGVWADRYNRKWLIVAPDAVVALATAVLGMAWLAGFTDLWVIVVVQVVRGIGVGVQNPAALAAVPMIVPKEHLMRFNSVYGAIQMLVYTAAPALAAALVTFMELGQILLIDVITAVVGIAFVLPLPITAVGKSGQGSQERKPGMRAAPGSVDLLDGNQVDSEETARAGGDGVAGVPSDECAWRDGISAGGSVGGDAGLADETPDAGAQDENDPTDPVRLVAGVVEAWRYLRAHPKIARTILLIVPQTLFFACPIGYSPVFITESFGSEAWMLAVSEMVFAVGAIVGGAVLAAWGGLKDRMAMMLLVCMCFEAVILVMGWSPNVWWFAALMAVGGLLLPGVEAVGNTVLQENVEESMLGRMMSFVNVVMCLPYPVGLALLAPLVEGLGARACYYICGALGVLAILGFCIRAPKIMAPGVEGDEPA